MFESEMTPVARPPATSGTSRIELPLPPLAELDDVRDVQEPRGFVEDADRHCLRVEYLPDPVAHGVVDRLQLELAGERLLHAVDQRELGVPLPRLVHEPRVLQRHAQAARERGQQADVVVGEGVRAVEVLERDAPAGLVTEDQRREEHRQRGLALPHRERYASLALAGGDVVDDNQSLRLNELLS